MHSGAFVWSTSLHQKDWAALGFPWLVFRVCMRCLLCLCSVDMEMVDTELGHVHNAQMERVIGAFSSTETIMQHCHNHTPHAHCSHLILILAYGEIVGIPFTDHCELFIQSQEWIVCAVIYYLYYFETLLHTHSGAMLAVMWACAHAYHDIDLLYILYGSHSVDPHCSVPESGDIEIQATHVSDHCFVWVYFVFKVLRASRLLLVLEGNDQC